MSTAETGISDQYSYTLGTLATGTAATAVATGVPNLNGTSRLLSVVRTTPSGTGPGPVSALIVPPSAATGAASHYQLEVFSQSTATTAVDNSNYTVYWQNSYTPSSVFPYGTAPAVYAQYAP